MGITSRCVQHSEPSSGGRRQRHERNFITAADTPDASGAISGCAGAVAGTSGESPASLLKLDSNRFLQRPERTQFFGRRKGERCASR